MHNFNTLGNAIKQVRLGQKFSNMKFGGLILMTLTALLFAVLVATKSCKAPVVKPDTVQNP